MRALLVVGVLVLAALAGWLLLGRSVPPTPSVGEPHAQRTAPADEPPRPTSAPPPASAAPTAPVAEPHAQTLDGTTPAQRFDKGAPDPVAERKLSPIVERVLAKYDVPHTLECRAGVCKLTTVHEPQKVNLWLEALTQDAQLQTSVQGNGIQFKPVPPTKDPVSGALLIQEEAYFAVK